MKRTHLIVAALATIVLAALPGGTPAQATPVQAPADRMVTFTIELLPMAKSGPTRCVAEAMNPPLSWPRVDAVCRGGKGQYRVKGTFKRIINGQLYTKYGPWRSVGSISTAYGDGLLDFARSPRYQVR